MLSRDFGFDKGPNILVYNHQMGKNLRLVKDIVLAKIRGLPYKLNFSVTDVCNSLCRTCNIGRISREKNFLTDPNQLTLDEIKKILAKFPSLCWLSLSGGEPFLRSDLLEIIKSAIELCPRLSVVSIPTNGLVKSRVLDFGREILRLRKRPIFYVNFSLDGPPEIHDYIRGVKKNYEITWQTYSDLKSLVSNSPDFYVGLETTISQYNQGSVYGFFQQLLTDGHRVTATVAHNTSFYLNKNHDNVSPDPRQIREALSLLRRHLSPFNPANLIFRIYLKHAAKFLSQPTKMVMPCSSGDRSLALYSDGTLSPCFMWSARIGNIRDFDYSVVAAHRSPKTYEYRKMISAGKCPICWTPCEATQTIIDSLPKLVLEEIFSSSLSLS